MILKDGKLDVLSPGEDVEMEPIELNESLSGAGEDANAIHTGLAIDIVRKEELEEEKEETREEKAKRLQWLLQQLIRETLQENNKELCKEIRDGIVKELDYQFRCQDEREQEREKEREKRNEEYYKKMDELLRKKSSKLKIEKKKRHLSF